MIISIRRYPVASQTCASVFPDLSKTALLRGVSGRRLFHFIVRVFILSNGSVCIMSSLATTVR
ncbi:protein involved in lipoprotein release [Pseudomonas syringae pv. actinidiae]|uniref:Protein involved in lipoprotein release n=1 Tax=Pseudomonas syringae pv. actinidiae TaxID=103796 RepID=A0AAN4Q4B2_PSESF|nr:protein involved in lipoprotein release [Pseudomonas syringae pv. actinidiae]